MPDDPPNGMNATAEWGASGRGQEISGLRDLDGRSLSFGRKASGTVRLTFGLAESERDGPACYNEKGH